MRVLITGGGTIEQIDHMRSITNKSSGRTAVQIAEYLCPHAEVFLLLAENIHYQNEHLKILNFNDVKSLKNLFFSLESYSFDLIVHAAAVSDYQVDQILLADKVIYQSKIPSGLTGLSIKLRPTEKLINHLKNLWPSAQLIGFKLTANLSSSEILDNIKRVMADSKANYIVHNDINERRAGLDNFTIYNLKLEKESIESIENLAHFFQTLIIANGEKKYDTLS